MRLARDRPPLRTARLLSGLVLFGLSLAVLLQARLGLDPWDVFDQGVSRRTGLRVIPVPAPLVAAALPRPAAPSRHPTGPLARAAARDDDRAGPVRRGAARR